MMKIADKIYQFFSKNILRLDIIKWAIIFLLYIFDLIIVQLLGIAIVSIAFALEWVISVSILFFVRQFFKKLKQKIINISSNDKKDIFIRQKEESVSY